jgi:regulator of replication initiation timing
MNVRPVSQDLAVGMVSQQFFGGILDMHSNLRLEQESLNQQMEQYVRENEILRRDNDALKKEIDRLRKASLTVQTSNIRTASLQPGEITTPSSSQK